jgi:hypothetical protein
MVEKGPSQNRAASFSLSEMACSRNRRPTDIVHEIFADNPRSPPAIMAKRTPYQERAIRNYYQNQDGIMLQRVGDLVTDLYLAEGKARERLWKRVETALEKLKIPAEQIRRVVASDNPTLLANLYQELLGKKE